MDRAEAIDINRTILTRIVATLIAMAGLADGGPAIRLPPVLRRALWRVLYPAEAAVRRLIVIAASGLKITHAAPRPFPKGLGRSGAGGGHLAFQLFDTRKRLSRWRAPIAAGAGPAIHFFNTSPLVPLFQPRPVEALVPKPSREAGASHLGRRLAAVKAALDNLPRQARRLLRWEARRQRMQNPKFTSPLRPGPPPGHREDGDEDIDLVLRTCHGLARQALEGDTS